MFIDSISLQQYPAREKIQITRQLTEWIVYNPLLSISPNRAICFYRHRSLISSSKCCYVRMMACQKCSIELLRRPVISVGFTGKRDSWACTGTGTFGSSLSSFIISFIAGNNLCSRISWFPRFTSRLRTGKMYQRTFSSKATHFHVIYEHNSRIFITFLPSISSNYNDLPTKNITFKYKTNTLTIATTISWIVEIRIFLRFAYGVIDTKMENAHNIGSSTMMARNNVRFNRFQYIIAGRQRGWHKTA